MRTINVAFICFVAFLAWMANERQMQTVVVGTGCEGPSPVAVAIEEDMLPVCESIEVHQIDRSY